MSSCPFHLAIQVRDIAEARAFYGDKLGLAEGRSSEHWIDYNLFGHQLVVHLNPVIGKAGKVTAIKNPVDGHAVPVPHFGVILPMREWRQWASHLETVLDDFVIKPYIRFAGEVGEQGTLFFLDPSGNALEFKGFNNIGQELFAKA